MLEFGNNVTWMETVARWSVAHFRRSCPALPAPGNGNRRTAEL